MKWFVIMWANVCDGSSGETRVQAEDNGTACENFERDNDCCGVIMCNEEVEL